MHSSAHACKLAHTSEGLPGPHPACLLAGRRAAVPHCACARIITKPYPTQFSGGEHDFYGPYAAARGKPMSITETAALWNPAPDTRASAPTELQVKSLWCARRAA